MSPSVVAHRSLSSALISVGLRVHALGHLRLTDSGFASPSILVLFRSSLSLHPNSPPPFLMGASPWGLLRSSPPGGSLPVSSSPRRVRCDTPSGPRPRPPGQPCLPPLLRPKTFSRRLAGYTAHAILPLSVPASTCPPLCCMYMHSSRPFTCTGSPCLSSRPPVPLRLVLQNTCHRPCCPACPSLVRNVNLSAFPYVRFGDLPTSHHRPAMMPRLHLLASCRGPS